MSARFSLRKGGSDPEFPWELRDPECPVEHDFSLPTIACEYKCDAYKTLEGALMDLRLDND